MNQTILQTLFLDNPEIPGEIASFCSSIPEYVQAEREYNRAAQDYGRGPSGYSGRSPGNRVSIICSAA